MRFSVLFAMTALAVMFLADSAAARMEVEPKVSYAADSVMETSGMKMQGRVFSAPGMERREQNTGGGQMITILRRDQGVMWILMPEEGMYMEHRLGSESASGSEGEYTIREQTVVGEEVVNGIKTTKSKVIIEMKNGVFGGFMWVTPEGIPVKMDAVAKGEGQKIRFRQELANLRIGPQDSSLFEVPAGYSKMGMPGFGGMGGMGGMEGLEEEAGMDGSEEEAGGLGGMGEMMKGMKGLFGR